jgi:hypothetical protein
MQAPPPQVQAHCTWSRAGRERQVWRHVAVVGLEWGWWLCLAVNPCRLTAVEIGSRFFSRYVSSMLFVLLLPVGGDDWWAWLLGPVGVRRQVCFDFYWPYQKSWLAREVCSRLDWCQIIGSPSEPPRICLLCSCLFFRRKTITVNFIN